MNFLAWLLREPGGQRPRSGWRLLAQFLLLSLLLFFVSMIFMALGQLSAVFAFLTDPIFIVFVAVTLSVYWARRWYDKRSMRSLGLALEANGNRDLAAGILISGGMMAAIFAVQWSLGWLQMQPGAAGSTAGEIGYWAAVFVMVGWYEELLARGYWLQNLQEGLGWAPAVLLSSLLFGAGHIGNPNATWVAVLGILLAGAFFCFAYLRTRQLWLPIGLHIGWNFFEGPIFGFPVSGLETARLLQHSSAGPQLWTGGAFGPEAGLILLPALALGFVLVHVYTRQRADVEMK